MILGKYSIRLYKEITSQKYYWKGIIEDCKRHVFNRTIYLRQRGGKKINLEPKSIITKGAKERFVVDRWNLYAELAESRGYQWIIDIIDYLSKFMGSFSSKENNTQNS